jgi:hypothetical protein
MGTTISAHFDGQFFVPDEPVGALRPGDRVEIVPVLESVTPAGEGSGWEEALLKAIQLHPIANHFVDDSRGSIYVGRGE